MQCDQPVASAPYVLHDLHQPAGIVGLTIQETLCIINIQLDVSCDLTYMYNCVYTTAILNSTHCISVCYVPNSLSYHYMSNVIFHISLNVLIFFRFRACVINLMKHTTDLCSSPNEHDSHYICLSLIENMSY